jgi:ATP-binding cassette subfamily C protein CydD
MASSKTDSRKAATRAWLRQAAAGGRRATRPVIAAALANTLLAIGQAACAARVLADALTGTAGARDWAPLIAFAALALLRAASGVYAEHAAARAGAAARRRLRSDTLGRLLGAAATRLRGLHSAERAALVVDRIEALDGYFARYLPAVVVAAAAPALIVLVVLFVDPVAALILAGAGLLVPVAMAVAGIGAAVASRNQFLAMTRLQARFIDRVRGIATIIAAGRAEDEARALAAAAAELRRRTLRVLRVAFLSSAALDLAAVLALVSLAIRYGVALQAGRLASPALAIFVLLSVPEFFAPLRAFSAAYQDRLHAYGAAEALTELPEPDAPDAPAPARAIRTVEARGVTVAFEDVRFTWDPSRGPALDGLTFRAPAGETTVLAGASGAGKSTVIEMLLGFIRPESGRVTINGADIADLVPEALSRLTAWIGQRPLLFAGSIADNIRFARPEASDDELARAAAAARVTDFAARLPDGLATMVGEGGYGLSGGEAQRVAIARAFLKNAPLLLLDEPTAHLDPATEADVLESLRRLALGRTVILASHAAAAHAFAGRRIDLRQGRAVPARGAA